MTPLVTDREDYLPSQSSKKTNKKNQNYKYQQTNSKYVIIDNKKIAHSKYKRTELITHNILNTTPN